MIKKINSYINQLEENVNLKSLSVSSAAIPKLCWLCGLDGMEWYPSC